jgi:hypothetical protein
VLLPLQEQGQREAKEGDKAEVTKMVSRRAPVLKVHPPPLPPLKRSDLTHCLFCISVSVAVVGVAKGGIGSRGCGCLSHRRVESDRVVRKVENLSRITALLLVLVSLSQSTLPLGIGSVSRALAPAWSLEGGIGSVMFRLQEGHQHEPHCPHLQR